MAPQQATNTLTRPGDTDQDDENFLHYFCACYPPEAVPRIARCGKIKANWQDPEPGVEYLQCVVCTTMMEMSKCPTCKI